MFMRSIGCLTLSILHSSKLVYQENNIKTLTNVCNFKVNTVFKKTSTI